MDSKLQELLDVAIDKTERGGLQWIAFDSESFRAKIGSSHLHIQRVTTDFPSDAQLHPHVSHMVQISDAQGRVVAEEEAEANVDGSGTLNRLFDAARKSALKTDRVIEEMLGALRGNT